MEEGEYKWTWNHLCEKKCNEADMNYNIVEEKFLFRAFNSYFLEADHNVNKRKRVSGILGSFDGLTYLHLYTF